MKKNSTQNASSKTIPDKKLCAKCRKYKKTLEDFSPCKTGRYGTYNYCKECRNKANAESNPNRESIDEASAKRTGLRKLGLKTCKSCKDIKSLNDFYSDPRHTDGKQTYCKDCFNQKANAIWLKTQYGISVQQFISLLESQDGVCWICKRAPKNRKFNVDHCHKTNLVRGLLCVNCNTNLLPIIERYPIWVKKSFEYLENPPAFDIIGKVEVPETNQARRKLNKMKQVYKIVIELEDLDNKEQQEIEQALEEALAYLPDDLIANIVSCDTAEEHEDY